MRLGKTGLGNRQHCAASRLRSGSQTRLRSATKRRNQPQKVNQRESCSLTNSFQDLTEIAVGVQEAWSNPGSFSSSVGRFPPRRSQ